jgi:hypothetical protein
MSVIFETLQKLGSASRERKGKASKSRKHVSIYMFKRAVLSFPGTLGLALFVILSALAVMYGITYFQNDVGKGEEVEEIFLPKAPTARYLPPTSQTNAEFAFIAHRSGEIEAPGPAKGSPATDGQTVGTPTPVFEEKREAEQNILPMEGLDVKGMRSVEELVAETPSGEMPSSEELPEEVPSAKASGPTDTSPASFPGKDEVHEPLLVAPDTPPDRQRVMSKGVSRTSSPSLGNKETPDTKSPVKADKSEREKLRSANIEKGARIGRLVTRVQQALGAGDASRVEMLLDELASLKGEKNSYVIKLKAFWCMKKGDYDSAESFLNSLLQRNENDLEAGINMAILELKTHRRQQARKRLKKLRHIYQDNTVIQDLLDDIEK